LDSLVGKYAGEYRLLAKIGQGGMSVVYRAQRPGSETALAVKILSPLAAETGTFTRRFQREAAVLQRLRHPNIVPVIDFGEVDGRPFLVMPLVEGGSLGDRLAKGAMSPGEGGRLLDQVADGLSYAHGQGVVHRDIKPSNILLDQQGNARLADFGLALVHDASISLTGSALIGTPSYMSPEQARGATVDARTDQYSLGIVLFEMTTGRLPFVADTPMAVVVKHMQEPLPLPRGVNPNVPLTVERVILKATAKDPGERFPDVHAMNDAFQEALAHTLQPSRAAPVLIPIPPSALATVPLPRPTAEPAAGWGRRRLGFAAALAVLAVLLCLAGGAGAFRVLGPPTGSQSASLPLAGLADSQLGLEATIEVLTTALAMQETGGPASAARLAELQATLTALPARAGGSKDLDTATPDPLGSPTDVPLTVQAAGASGTPAPPLPTSTPRTPTRTPSRTPAATATRTQTPIATPLLSASPSVTTAPASPGPSATLAASVVVPSATRTRTATSAPPTATSAPPTATSAPPTATAAPPTATSAPPTSTRTPEPPPPQDLCENIELLNPEVDLFTARIDVRNRNDERVEITALWLDWPGDRGRLDRIRFKSNTIWDRGDNSPPTTIDPSEWISGRSRSISADDTETLTFIFYWGSSSDDYALEITFDGSCEVDW
jgi:serine/threonine-protein kinase